MRPLGGNSHPELFSALPMYRGWVRGRQKNLKIKVAPKKLVKTKDVKNDEKSYPGKLMKTNYLS